MRLPGWLDNVSEYIDSCRNKPFVWGEHDCCLFASNVAKLITGVDYFQDYRGHYTTERGALRALRRYGAGNLPDTITQYLGDSLPPLLLQRGDVALIGVDGLISHAVGVCWADGVVYLGTKGLVSMPLNYAVCGWRID